MPGKLIQALRSGLLEEVVAAVAADPKAARSPQAATEAGRLAFQKALELLEKKGADLNASWRGYRPLHSLIQESPHSAGKPELKRLKCMDWLLEHGADPELTGAWPPARALLVAAFTGVPAYVDRLMAAGAKYDGFAASALGDEPFLRNVLSNRPEFANERDGEALTALQCAAGSRMPGAPVLAIAKLLIDSGADIHAKTKSWTHEVDALYLAANSKNLAIFELLLDLGADPTEGLTSALWNATDEFAEAAMAHGADPNRAVSAGRPLLNDLIRWGQMRQATWLVKRGASPNLPDDRGWTAMHQAASRGNEKMMRVLIDAGGDLTRGDKSGQKPRDIASSGRPIE